MQRLKELWTGQLPLEIAFWRYAVAYGFALNLAATIAALFLVALEFPIALALVVHLLPVPYSVAAGVGVWRSADRYAARPNIATLTKACVVAWFGFLLVI